MVPLEEVDPPKRYKDSSADPRKFEKAENTAV
jgi:hypothetical protein